MEKDGLIPVPIFINGVEAHTVVRDLLTSPHEQHRRADGIIDIDTLSKDCAQVKQNSTLEPLMGIGLQCLYAEACLLSAAVISVQTKHSGYLLLVYVCTYV